MTDFSIVEGRVYRLARKLPLLGVSQEIPHPCEGLGYDPGTGFFFTGSNTRHPVVKVHQIPNSIHNISGPEVNIE